MGIESSFIPFPSEVVVPPAAWKACDEESSIHPTEYNWLNIIIIVLFATLGAIIGALINYYLSFFLGRPIVYWFADSKLGHLLLLNSDKIKKAEAYFNEHGNSSTFIGRLVPGIRQLISIPAGLARMNYWKFLLFTTIGAGGWHSELAALGWYLHAIVPEDQLNDKISEYAEYIKIIILALVVLAILYFVVKKWVLKKK